MEEGAARAGLWSLYLGLGRHSLGLATFARALAPHWGSGCTVVELSDWGDLLDRLPLAGKLTIDVEDLALEDLGFLRRVVQRSPELEPLLIGRDPSLRSARELCALRGARWLPWPIDIVELEGLLRASSAAEARAARTAAIEAGPPGAAPAPPQPPAPPGRRPEIVEIERILAEEQPAAESEAWPPSNGPSAALSGASDQALEASGDPSSALAHTRPQELEEPVEESAPRPEPLPSARGVTGVSALAREGSSPPSADPAPDWRRRLPPFYRQQIADLADIAQRLQLSYLALSRAEGNVAQRADRLGQLEGEVFRLVQFARTLGYLVAPPTGGEQAIDLAQLLREQLAGWAGEGAQRASWRMSVPEGLWVRSDKGLLLRAIDAVLALARACAAQGDAIYVAARELVPETPGETSRVAIEVTFPSGPLADLQPAEIIEPYSLRRRLSQLGPNALAAAEGILRGQGGRLELLSISPETLRWRIELPAGRPVAAQAATPPETAAGPFE